MTFYKVGLTVYLQWGAETNQRFDLSPEMDCSRWQPMVHLTQLSLLLDPWIASMFWWFRNARFLIVLLFHLLPNYWLRFLVQYYDSSINFFINLSIFCLEIFMSAVSRPCLLLDIIAYTGQRINCSISFSRFVYLGWYVITLAASKNTPPAQKPRAQIIV